MGPGQNPYDSRAALDDRRAGALFQYEASNLVLASEPDAGLASSYWRSGRAPGSDRRAGDAIVQADHHHPPPSRTLLVELVELVLSACS